MSSASLKHSRVEAALVMRDPKEKRHHLTLVVSRPVARSDEAKGPPQSDSGQCVQLALFPDEELPSVVYVRPSPDNLERIVEGVRARCIHAILDIRETPYLSFPCMSRQAFLDLLLEYQASYVNMHKLMRSRGIETVSEFLLSLAEIRSADDGVLRQLKDLVSHGPVFVFSDKVPSDDQSVSVLEAALRRTNLEYETSYLAC